MPPGRARNQELRSTSRRLNQELNLLIEFICRCSLRVYVYVCLCWCVCIHTYICLYMYYRCILENGFASIGTCIAGLPCFAPSNPFKSLPFRYLLMNIQTCTWDETVPLTKLDAALTQTLIGAVGSYPINQYESAVNPLCEVLMLTLHTWTSL